MVDSKSQKQDVDKRNGLCTMSPLNSGGTMNTQKTPREYPHVALTKDASILACNLRGESHESLACLAANLTVERNDLLAALRTLEYRLGVDTRTADGITKAEAAALCYAAILEAEEHEKHIAS